MADIYDVETALTSLAQTAVYPNGTSEPSVANCDVRIYPGWPIPDTLDADLTARKVHVSIFPTNIARVSTRFDTRWYTTNINVPTITLMVNNTANTVTLNGTITVLQSCMIIVNGIGYSYGIQSTDTLNSIATQLANIIPNTSAFGNVITISGAFSIVGRISFAGTSVREVAREKRMMIVTVWAPTPLIRAQIGGAIIPLFAATYRVALPDGFYGQLKYSGSREVDILEKVKCYRRDIHFEFEFATTQSENDYAVADNVINVTPFFTSPNPPF